MANTATAPAAIAAGSLHLHHPQVQNLLLMNVALYGTLFCGVRLFNHLAATLIFALSRPDIPPIVLSFIRLHSSWLGLCIAISAMLLHCWLTHYYLVRDFNDANLRKRITRITWFNFIVLMGYMLITVHILVSMFRSGFLSDKEGDATSAMMCMDLGRIS